MTPPATFTETVLADSFAAVLAGGRGARDSFSTSAAARSR